MPPATSGPVASTTTVNGDGSQDHSAQAAAMRRIEAVEAPLIISSYAAGKELVAGLSS